jgi:hypothetical protein
MDAIISIRVNVDEKFFTEKTITGVKRKLIKNKTNPFLSLPQ